MQPGNNIVGKLKGVVSGIYVTLRNFCAIGMLCMLIYTGIRIVLSSASASEQKEWKMRLMDWLKAVVLLVTVHFLMIGIFYISEIIMDAMKSSNNISLTQQIGRAALFSSWNFWEEIVLVVIYGYVTYLTVVFAIAYFKRLMWVAILIVIAPVVSLLYCFGKDGKAIFSRWLKEFSTAVLIQPYHYLIYYILIALPFNLALRVSGTSTGGLVEQILNGDYNFTTWDPSVIFVYTYCLIALSMIRPFEKFLRQLLGMAQGKVANESSFESGKQTLNVAKDFVKELGTGIAALMTGGASLVAKGAPSALTKMAAGGAGPTAPTGIGPGGAGPTGPTGIGPGGTGAPIPGIGAGVGPTPTGTDDEPRFSGKDPKFSEILANHIQNGTVLSGIGDTAKSVGHKIGKTKTATKVGNAYKKLNSINIGEGFTENKAIGRIGKAVAIRGASIAKYAMTPEGRQIISGMVRSGQRLRDTMYLSGDALKDWEPGVKRFEDKTNDMKNINMQNFINNSENINAVVKKKNLVQARLNINKDRNVEKATEEANEIAKNYLKNNAEPYLNRGITDVNAIMSLIETQKRTGASPEVIIKNAGPQIMANSRVETFVNNEANINAVHSAQVEVRGGDPTSVPSQRDRARIADEVAPYVANGVSDPQVLARLTEIESSMKREGTKASNAQEVMKLDKLIEKALPAYQKDADKVIEKLDKKIGELGKGEEVKNVVKGELRRRAGITNN